VNELIEKTNVSIKRSTTHAMNR